MWLGWPEIDLLCLTKTSWACCLYNCSYSPLQYSSSAFVKISSPSLSPFCSLVCAVPFLYSKIIFSAPASRPAFQKTHRHLLLYGVGSHLQKLSTLTTFNQLSFSLLLFSYSLSLSSLSYRNQPCHPSAVLSAAPLRGRSPPIALQCAIIIHHPLSEQSLPQFQNRSPQK